MKEVMNIMQKWEYAILIFWGIAGWTRRVEFTHHDKWEPIGKEDLLPTLRRLGEEGWELVSAERGGSVTITNTEGRYIFKRPLL